MFIVSMAVLLAALALIEGVLYSYFSRRSETELHNEVIYIAHGVESLGEEYFEGLRDGDSRITWIAADGTVLYDSDADPATMENHAGREEVQKALSSGVGEVTRYSATMAESTTYYALRLQDGTVLRVSSTQYTLLTLVLGVLQPTLVVLVVAVALAMFLSSRISRSIVEPINRIDLQNPEETEVYEELSPLLGRIARQNREIGRQMEELDTRRREFEAITENMRESLIIIDGATHILSTNNSAKRLFGCSDADIGKSVLTLSRSEDFVACVESALKGENREGMLVLEDHTYQLIASPVTNLQRIMGAMLLLFDVTERQERDRLRREFTANVSHELKTPLTSISGFAEIISKGYVKPEDIPRFADNIYKESQRLITLVEDIIRLSRLDENAVGLEKETVALDELAASVVKRLQPQADQRNIRITCDLSPVQVTGVRQILDEMAYNLVDNAIKYNKEAGAITVSVKEREGHPVLQVADTGIGIPAAEQERVFERFYRVNKSHSKTIGGTGLGLSIVKHGALFHHAKVDLQSEPNQGTTITVTF